MNFRPRDAKRQTDSLPSVRTPKASILSHVKKNA